MTVKPKSELKKCPFCGYDNIVVDSYTMESYERILLRNPEGKWYQCYCLECFASTSEFPTQEAAEAAWNRRDSE